MLHNGEFVTDRWVRMDKVSRMNDSRWKFRHKRMSHTCIDTSATMTAGEAAMAHSCINMLQDAATHCQHTATHCKTLQYTCSSLTCRRLPRARRLDEHAATQCNTVQHTATHCNTSTRTSLRRWPRANRPDQHIATRCNTLATHCNTLTRTSLRRWPRARRPDQQSATQYNTQATHGNTLQHTATHCNTLQHTCTDKSAAMAAGEAPRPDTSGCIITSATTLICCVVNESCHTYEWVMSHIWMRHVTHTNESCHSYGWVMLHIRMSHATHTNASCHADMLWTSHVNYTNESYYIYECVMTCRGGWLRQQWRSSIVDESRHMNKWVMSHIRMSQVSYIRMSHDVSGWMITWSRQQ